MNNRIPEWKNGKIANLTGRKDGKGFPELFEVSIELEDSTTLALRMPSLEGPQDRGGLLPGEFVCVEFQECPICLEPNPSSDEHVPPGAIGGVALLKTCLRCNNEFGTKIEPHLIAWYESQFGAFKISGGGLPGRRNVGKVMLRVTSDGTPALVLPGIGDPAIEEILNSGDFRIHPIAFDESRKRLALLKTAYLAACLLLKEIPRTPIAEAVRKELLDARDAPRKQSIELSEWTNSLYVGITGTTPQPKTIELGYIPWDDAHKLILVFNKYIAMQWPIDPIVMVQTDDADLG